MLKIAGRITPSNYLQFFQIARYAGLFLSGVFLAKFGVSINIIGQYEFILFLSGIISFFWIGGVFQTVLSTYHSCDNKIELLSKTISAQLALGLISSLLAFLYLVFIDKKNNFNYQTIIAITVYLLLNTLTFFNENYYLIKEKYNKLTLYAIGNFSLQILAILIVIIVDPSIKNFIYALLCISIWKTIILMYNLWVEKIKVSLIPDIGFLKLCSPLIAGILISGSSDYIDSFLVLHNFGSESFAIFKYGAKEFPLSLLLANSLSMAMIPSIVKKENINDGINELKSQGERLMNILFPITWVFLISSKYLYPIIFSSQFSDSAAIFNVYLLLVISRTIFPQTVVMASQRRDIILNTAYWEITINVFSSLILMWKFGIIGIAYGTVVAFLSEKLILAYRLKKLNVDFQQYTNFSKWFLFTVITVLLYFFVENFL